MKISTHTEGLSSLLVAYMKYGMKERPDVAIEPIYFADVASMKLEVEVTLESEAKLGNKTSISASNFDRIFNVSVCC